jgi:hypothetical protein
MKYPAVLFSLFALFFFERYAAIPNPASVNCVDKEGIPVMYVDSTGAQYGVCWYSQERCCEEWAMFRNADQQCPMEGLPLPNGIKPAPKYARYQCTTNPVRDPLQLTFQSSSGV